MPIGGGSKGAQSFLKAFSERSQPFVWRQRYHVHVSSSRYTHTALMTKYTIYIEKVFVLF